MNDGQVDAAVIARPAAGELRVVDIDRRGEIDFDFPVDSVRVIALDVDIILFFSDGAKVLLPHFGLMLTGPNPPKLRFAGRTVRSTDLLSTISEVTASDQTASISNIGEVGKAADNQSTPQSESNSSPSAPMLKLANSRIEEPTLGLGAAPVSVQPASVPLATSSPSVSGSGAVYSPSVQGYTGGGLFPTSSLTLTAKLYNIPDIRSEVNPNDTLGHTIYGGTGGIGSDQSTSYAAQAVTRSIPGPASNNISGTTDHNDVVYLDDPNLANTQSSTRKLVVTLESPKSGYTATGVLITDPPAGFVIMNGTQTSTGTFLKLDEGGKTVTITLSYKLPGDEAELNDFGYYSINRLTLKTVLVNSAGFLDTQTNDLYLGIAKAQSNIPLEAILQTVPGVVYTLWTNPPGSSVNLGGGDDVVYLSAGADTVTGGDGLDTLNYSRSSGAITVNLGARTAKGGFAEGDLLVDTFENIVGSVWADNITGSDGNNTIVTGGNADTVDGAGGVDTLDFTASTLGTTLDLSKAIQGFGGAASKMYVLNVENVLGSATAANYLAGNAANNLLQGGIGNDTFIGSSGLDTYIGVGGQDIVDFRSSTTSVSISADDAGTGSNSTSHFEKIKTLYGAKNASNFIAFGASITDAVIGGDLADTISGIGGSGSITAGAGSDSVYASGQYTVVWESGSDSLVADAGKSSLLDISRSSTGVNYTLGESTRSNLRLSSVDIIQAAGFQNIVATGGNDCLIASSASNYIDAGAGADTVIARSGADSVNNGNDTFIGGNNSGDLIDFSAVTSANLSITLGLTSFTTLNIGSNTAYVSGFKSFRSGAGNDYIVGDASDNTIAGGDGDDTMIGGGQAGDWLSYRFNTVGATVVFNSETALYGTATSAKGNDSFIGFLNVRGSDYADSIITDGQNNSIQAAGGNDTINSGFGSDYIDGGDGFDIVSYAYLTDPASGRSLILSDNITTTLGQGSDIELLVNIEGLIGGAGNDTIVGNSASNSLIGDGGNDSFFGSGGSDTMDGGSGLDVLSYRNTSIDHVVIDLRPDLLTKAGRVVKASANNDTLGIDYVYNIETVLGTNNGDCIIGDDGDNYLSGAAGNDTIIGLGGSDTLDGGVGDDSLVGLGDGGDPTKDDNYFIGSSGNDKIDGGLGSSTLDYSTFKTDITAIIANSGFFTVTKSATENDQVINVRNIYSGSGNDCLIGSDQDNWLSGGDGNDTLLAGKGNDTITGGKGNDSLDGGEGTSDLLDLSYSTVAITFSMGASSISIASDDIDQISNFENLRGGQKADSLRGDSGNNWIDGFDGSDTISGGGGNNTLVGSAEDMLDYSTAASGITYVLGTTATISAGNSRDIVSGFGNILGSGFNDSIIGSDGNNNIILGNGNDTVYSRDGDDTVSGGAGNDFLHGGAGSDYLDYSYLTGQGVSLVLNGLNVAIANISSSDIDTITAFENVVGGSGNDTIFGDGAGNTILGGNGQDCISGGLGNDWLDGDGSVGDTVDYSYATSGVQFTLGQTNFVTVSTIDMDTVSGFENFVGGTGNDTVTTDTQQNTVRLGDGDDLLYASLGNDSYDGGTGQDTIDFSKIGAGAVSVSLNANGSYDYYVNSGNSWSRAGSFANFEKIIGTSSADIILASGGAETVDGGSGADTMGRGDTATTNDAYYIDNANDYVFDGRGNDTAVISLTEFTTNSNVQVKAYIYSGSDRFNFFGGAGDDYVYVGKGDETLRGGDGNNTIDYSALGLTGGISVKLNGSNAISVQNVGGANQISGFRNIVTGAGDDTITGDDYANTINGGEGNDLIFASLGQDTVDGGGGDDTLDYSAYANDGYDVTYQSNGAGYQIKLIKTNDNNVSETTLQYAFNVERIIGGTGNLFINFSDATTSVLANGQSGNDTIFGGSASDTLNGRAGNDCLQGGLGNDRLDGGDDSDTVSYNYATVGVSVNLRTGVGSAGTGDIDSLFNIENIAGSQYGDTFVGNDGNNIIDGSGGLDIVSYAYATSNLNITIAESGTFAARVSPTDVDSLINIEGIIGGSGDDIIVGNSQANVLGGGGGNNSLVAGGGGDCIIGGMGNDTIDGGDGNDTVTYANISADSSIVLTQTGSDITASFYDKLTGALTKRDILRNIEYFLATSGNDTINALGLTSGGPTISGGDGNDSILGNNLINYILGGKGDDTLNGGGGNDTVNGEEGNNWADVSFWGGNAYFNSGGFGLGNSGSYSRFNNIITGSGNDCIKGDSNANYIMLGGGNDYGQGNGGNDTLDGGDGVDVIDYSYAPVGGAISIVLNGSVYVTVSVSATDIDQIVNFENVIGTGSADWIGGDSNSNSLVGGAGNDTIFGGAGNDTISGGTGSDSLDGGAGDGDTIDFTDQTGAITINLANGNRDTVFIGTDKDTFWNFENVVGGSAADSIFGNLKDNYLSGGAGNDTIIGFDGNDTLGGGLGNDSLDGGTGVNWLDYSYQTSASVSLTIALGAAGATSTGGTTGDNDTFVNFDAVIGGSGADSILGNGNDNSFIGRSGNDTIDGQGGSDWAVYSYVTGTSGITVQLAGASAGKVSAPSSDTDTLFNIENIAGSNQNDSIFGDSLANILFGAGGADTISGGGGNDTIDGGTASPGTIDVANYSYVATGISVSLAASAPGVGSVSATDVDRLINIEGVIGGSGNDFVSGDSLSNIFWGNNGNDTFAGSGGNDTFDGGAGTDIADYSWLGTGATLVVTSSGTAWSVQAYDSQGNLKSTDRLVNVESILVAGFADLSSVTTDIGLLGSNAIADTLIGGSGSNSISGSGNNDCLVGGLGNDSLDGGSGISDWASYSYVTGGTGVSVQLNGASRGAASVSTTDNDTLINIENIQGSDFADTILGDSLANILSGGGGADTISGGGGNDTIIGGSASDGVIDVASYSYLTTVGVTVSLGGLSAGTAVVSATDTDRLVNFEGAIGGGGNDCFVGDSLSNMFWGDGGNDTFAGNVGNDTFDGGSGNDLVDYSWLGTKASVAITGSGTTLTVAAYDSAGILKSTDILTNIESVAVAGMADASKITVNIGLVGGSDNDTLIGGSGANTFVGNGGNDILDGRAAAAGKVNVADYSYITTNKAYTLSGESQYFVSIGLGDTDLLYNIEGLVFGSGNDTLMGDASDNYLGGGAGNDSFAVTAGNDTIDGGTGYDSINYSTYARVDLVSNGQYINATFYNMVGQSVGAQSLINVENIICTTGQVNLPTLTSDFKFSSSLGGSSLVTGSGNDTLVAYGVGQSIDLGGGSDLVDYTGLAAGNNISVSVGTVGTSVAWTAAIRNSGVLSAIDTLFNVDSLTLSSGNDTFQGSSALTIPVYLDGGAGNDFLFGGTRGDTLRGGAGNDTLDGGNAATINSGNTNLNFADYSYATNGISVYLDYGVPSGNSPVPATAAITVTVSPTDVDVLINIQNIIGTQYNDTIFSRDDANQRLDNTIFGGAGDDLISAGFAYNGDFLDGGDGIDTYVINDFNASQNPYLTNISNQIGTMYGGGTIAANNTKNPINYSAATLFNFENVVGSKYADYLIGSDAANSLFGGSGNDTIRGGLGNDTIDGGAGNDVADYSTSTTAITATLSASVSVNDGLGATDLLLNIEGMIGSAFDDFLTGYNVPDWLDGNAGNDTIQGLNSLDTILGGSGNDSLVGLSGNDCLIGGLGSDTISGGVGNDILDGAGSGADSSAIDVVDYSYIVSTATSLTVSVASIASAAGSAITVATNNDIDTVRNFEGIIGGSGNDCFIGDANANYLGGGIGNDTLLGGLGNDTLVGGTGNDSLDGGDDTDTLDYSSRLAGTNITVTLNGSTWTTVSVGTTERDQAVNIENIIGGGGNDCLVGDSNNNFIRGGAGNDTLAGGGVGNDTLWGEAGNDVIQINRDSTSLALMRVDGGAGSDTVQFKLLDETGRVYSGSDLAAAITNVEYLDFKNSFANTISLTAVDLAKLAIGSANNKEITLRSDLNDVVNVSDFAGYTIQSSSVTGGTDYTIKDTNNTIQAILHLVPG